VFTQSHVQAGVTLMILMHISGLNKQYPIHFIFLMFMDLCIII